MNRIVLEGRIADGASLTQVPRLYAPGPVRIDTDAVTFVNSAGMRELVRFIRTLRESGHEIVMERVADVLMTQINMLEELARSVSVASFHAQYVCPACGAESAPIVDVAQHRALLRTLQAPRLPCPECGSQMDLGDFPERYLSVFKA
jgi:ABC-type transporter Mla MlaB component/DNA-directed RNA polymerase subunit RPC12/RpoP